MQALTPLAQCDSHPARAASVAAGAGQGKAKAAVSRSSATAHTSEVGQGPGGAMPADAAEQLPMDFVVFAAGLRLCIVCRRLLLDAREAVGNLRDARTQLVDPAAVLAAIPEREAYKDKTFPLRKR